MIELLLRCNPSDAHPRAWPQTAEEAKSHLLQGQAQIAALLNAPANVDARLTLPLSAADLGAGDYAGVAPVQTPFAAVLGCSDARVPVEFVFGQGVNALFVVRVAGNTPAGEGSGSLDYAVANLADLRLLAVLGHTRCGAVTATVDALLEPATYAALSDKPSLHAIVDSVTPPARIAVAALEAVYGGAAAMLPGYRAGLIELAVILNAAMTARALRRTYVQSIDERFDVVYGVYNLLNHVVGQPGAAGTADVWVAGLASPPADDAAVDALGEQMARSRYIEGLLEETA